MSDYGDQCRELREAKRATQPSTSRSFIRWLSNQTIPPKSADCGLFACGRSPHSASPSAPTYRRTAMQNDKTTDAPNNKVIATYLGLGEIRAVREMVAAYRASKENSDASLRFGGR